MPSRGWRQGAGGGLGGRLQANKKKGEAGRRGGWPRSGTGNRQPIAGAGAKVGRGRGPAAGGPTPRADTGGEGGGAAGSGGQGPRANSKAGEGGGGSGLWLALFQILPGSA